MAVSISRSVAPLIARRWRSTSRRRSSRVRRRNGPHCASLRSAVSSFRLSAVARPRQCTLLLLEEPPLHPLLRREVGPFDLRPRVMSWARGQRALIDGELFDRGLLERSAEARERVAIVEVVEVAFVFARRTADVETGLRAGPGERDVTPLLQARFAGPENEGAFDGEALGGMPGRSARQRDPTTAARIPALITRLSHALAAAVTPRKAGLPHYRKHLQRQRRPGVAERLERQRTHAALPPVVMGPVRPPLVCRGGVGRVGHRS